MIKMVHNKRKKLTRYRGSHTHGGGSKKKRRGAGHRGGRGKAGTGKRGDQNKPTYWKEKYFSGPPFKSKQQKPLNISIAQLETRFETLKKSGIIKENKGLFEIDFGKPYKLLSQGKPTRKYLLKYLASKKAQEKILAAGGKVEEKPQPTIQKSKASPASAGEQQKTKSFPSSAQENNLKK